MTRAFSARGTRGLLTVRRDGELVALLPLLRSGPLLRSPTSWHTPVLAPLSESGAAEATLWHALLDLPSHLVTLRFLPAAAAARLAAVAGDHHVPMRLRPVQRSPFVDVTSTAGDYWAHFSRRWRKTVTRQRRQLQKEGVVTWELDDGSAGLEQLLVEGLRIEALGWKGRQRTAIACDPTTRQAYEEVTAWAARERLLRLAFLRVDGRAAAFDLVLEQGHALYVVKGGYDPRFARYSPGTLNTLALLDRAFASPRLQTVELLGSEAPWKAVLATGVREQYAATAFPHPLAGVLEAQIYRGVRAAWNSTRRHLPARLGASRVHVGRPWFEEVP